ALLTGGIAFFLTMKAMKPKESAPLLNPMVVGLEHDLEIGSTLRKEDLDLISPPANMDSTYLIRDPLLVVGKINNRFLAKGTAVRTIDLLSPEDNLASLIPEGYQAMTVPVTLPSNLVNLIQVGNRTDVILTYSTGAGTQFKSITLMKNVKVIGVSNDKTGGSGGQLQITLAVTPEGSKVLAYSLKRGTLNVAVRSLSESDKEQPEHFFTLPELFKDQELDAGQITKEKGKAPLTEEIEIIRGLTKETYRFINGKAESRGFSGDQKS
ncbi:MAG: Flp pilus assembly protein CpaB, partial [Candidatus Omnitrophica bacterium]|nr:Flp pilus assembly protein CpaB [Candidatus Omnitrophota bacterium]